MEPFITTYTGRKVNPLNLQVSDVCLADVAHHLALLNRFVGALRFPVSIAQHSVYVSRLLDGTGHELLGLLHDGSEAYLGDVSKWVKQHAAMDHYREAEHRAEIAVYAAFGLAHDEPLALREADDLMVRFEAERGFKGVHCHMFDIPSHPPLTPAERKRVGRWAPWSWKASEEAFLTRFRELTALRGVDVSGMIGLPAADVEPVGQG
jgi:hypothetical protein